MLPLPASITVQVYALLLQTRTRQLSGGGDKKYSRLEPRAAHQTIYISGHWANLQMYLSHLPGLVFSLIQIQVDKEDVLVRKLK